MSDRPSRDDPWQATPASSPPSQPSRSQRPLQSVRVSTSPPELTDPPPRSEHSFATQTLIGVAPAAAASAPAPSESWPQEQPDARPADDATQTVAAPESTASLSTPEPASETPTTSVLVAERAHTYRAPRRAKILIWACAAALLGASVLWLSWPAAKARLASAPVAPALQTVAIPGRRPPAIEAPPAATALADPPQHTGAEPPAATSGTTSVLIEATPAGAKFLRAGKEVGTSPFTVELQPGEKRAFEVVREGYATRKLVVDGSKSEILVGLLPEGARTKKPAGGAR